MNISPKNVHCSMFNCHFLERIPEHDLSDPHKSGLIIDLAEVRITDRVRVQASAHGDAVKQVQHFDFHESRLTLPKPEVLHKRRVDILLCWRPNSSDGARRCSESERRRGSEAGRAEPCRLWMVRGGQPVFIIPWCGQTLARKIRTLSVAK